ncbi:19887_t:CDS:2 [Cetraspora pellucida]|uniref:19887_t:CDS:1 n=1 Tax=Cetraspora pellucida TaxID=1433469 RepID=A0A9N9HPA7_9GLOM|nr:19887_t:CDS:2 [Cetraspora pellucida]
MQSLKNTKDLSDKLSDKYVVSFLSRNLAADESLEDFNEVEDSVNIDDICTELEQTVISERSREKSTRGNDQNKGKKNSSSSGKKAAIYVQLPKPPSFDALVHNISYHKGYIIILTTIISNTNEYAQIKNANAMGRVWTLLTLDELKIWLEIVIYMGVIKLPRVTDYWTINSKFSKHNIIQKIKVEPLASHIRDISKQLYIPRSQVSVDEMMIRFSGYTYTFTFESHIVNNSEITIIPGLNKTGSLVLYIVTQLPKRHAYNIYMDNYFISILLFYYLRTKGYRACNTVRTNSSMFSKILKFEKSIYLDWNILSGVVVNNVLVMLWVDNANVQNIFGEASQKEILIPKIINDYNHFMGSVDTADQFRSYYNCQITSLCNWLPLMFWLIDMAIVNSYIIYKQKDNLT